MQLYVYHLLSASSLFFLETPWRMGPSTRIIHIPYTPWERKWWPCVTCLSYLRSSNSRLHFKQWQSTEVDRSTDPQSIKSSSLPTSVDNDRKFCQVQRHQWGGGIYSHGGNCHILNPCYMRFLKYILMDHPHPRHMTTFHLSSYQNQGMTPCHHLLMLTKSISHMKAFIQSPYMK